MLTKWAADPILGHEQDEAPSLLRQWTARYGNATQTNLHRLADTHYYIQEFASEE